MERHTQPISLKTLSNALKHVQTLVFAEEHIFDDEGKLRDLLQRLEVSFDDHEDDVRIESLREEIRTLKGLVFKDELTGILNRRGIFEEFNGFFKEALFSKEKADLRHGVVIKDFSVVLFDLDDFKSINDTLGHEEGDRVLREFSHLLKKNTRDIDAVGRLGGEEFIMGLLGAAEEESYQKAEKIRANLEHTSILKDRQVTTSVGVASLRSSNARTLDELIKYADAAMYEAKQNRGKNMVVRYSEIA